MLMHPTPRSCAPWSAPSGAPRLARIALRALPALPDAAARPLPSLLPSPLAVLVRLAPADEPSDDVVDLGVALGVPATQRGREYIAPAGRLGERPSGSVRCGSRARGGPAEGVVDRGQLAREERELADRAHPCVARERLEMQLRVIGGAAKKRRMRVQTCVSSAGARLTGDIGARTFGR